MPIRIINVYKEKRVSNAEIIDKIKKKILYYTLFIHSLIG